MSELVLKCQCATCNGLPFAKIQNGCVIIIASHHGHNHVNVVTLGELIRLAEKTTEEIELAAR